jgi:RNA polymerase sigma-70 factor (ECF subfamily)
MLILIKSGLSLSETWQSDLQPDFRIYICSSPLSICPWASLKFRNFPGEYHYIYRMDVLRGNMDRLIGDRGVKDPAVVEAMMVEYSAPLYRLALSILRDPEDAQDAVQDTFIQAAAGMHRYQVGTNFKAWLFKIAVNTCLQDLRKRRARGVLQQAWQALARQSSPQSVTEAHVEQAETRVELWNLVEGLDEKHRLVIVLRLAHDLTVGEISQVLGVNEKTVYTRLYSAFARLRTQIRLRPEFAHLWDEVQP